MNNKLNNKKAIVEDNDIKYHYYRGKGPGGQHRNKTENACKATHVPTGITANCDARTRAESTRKAKEKLIERVEEAVEEVRAAIKKNRRDELIHNMKTIRTYNEKRNQVKDHRTGETAPMDAVLDGDIDKLLIKTEPPKQRKRK